MTGDGPSLRILCPKLKAVLREPGLQWLIGSPSVPFTVVSSVRCLHTVQDDPFSPDYEAEDYDLRSLLPRGFNVIGAIYVSDTNWEVNARKAAVASAEMSRILCRGDAISSMIGAAGDLNAKELHYFILNSSDCMEPVVSLTFEENPEKFLWEIGCLLRADVEMKLPIYFPATGPSGACAETFRSEHEHQGHEYHVEVDELTQGPIFVRKLGYSALVVDKIESSASKGYDDREQDAQKCSGTM